jgi:hypothetical protein
VELPHSVTLRRPSARTSPRGRHVSSTR